MVQSQEKPSHSCRHTPWWWQESSVQVVLGPAGCWQQIYQVPSLRFIYAYSLLSMGEDIMVKNNINVKWFYYLGLYSIKLSQGKEVQQDNHSNSNKTIKTLLLYHVADYWLLITSTKDQRSVYVCVTVLKRSINHFGDTKTTTRPQPFSNHQISSPIKIDFTHSCSKGEDILWLSRLHVTLKPNVGYT